MTKRNAPLIVLVVSLIMLSQLIGGIGCQVGKSESGSLIATAREAVSAHIKWLEELKFVGPDPPAPLNVNLNSVESHTHRIGIDGRYTNVDMGAVGGMGSGDGGVGGGGGGGGGG